MKRPICSPFAEDSLDPFVNVRLPSVNILMEFRVTMLCHNSWPSSILPLNLHLLAHLGVHFEAHVHF